MGRYNSDWGDNSLIVLRLVGLSCSMLALGIGLGKAIRDSQNDKKAEEVTTCNAICIVNGEYTRQDNIEIKGNHSRQYDASYVGDNSLVVYVYGDDISQRYLFTEFIESNIEIKQDDNGEYVVTLNEENLTEDNYNSFVNSLSEEKEDKGHQRKRT